MTRLPLLVVSAMLLGAAAPAQDLSAGAEIAQHGTTSGIIPCMACHGSRLQGNASIGAPPLAGMPERVVITAFSAIAEGKFGNNVVMQNIARSLTDEQRKSVAAYLVSLEPPKHPLNVVIQGAVQLTPLQIVELSTGAEIVQHGTPSGALPCTTCHGSHLQGNASIGAPPLAGMPQNATLAALGAIAAGKMGTNTAMRNTARALSPEQRKAVAAILALTTPTPRHRAPGTGKARPSSGSS
ncbi:MAG: c-type cytochrome [Acetobacteraceae bacterium]